jgi:hypothetical protein
VELQVRRKPEFNSQFLLDAQLAQPVLPADVEKTIRYAIWRHGAAAWSFIP